MKRALQYGKGVNILTGFDVGAQVPIDSRFTVKSNIERDAIITDRRQYEGMIVFVEDDKKTYQLVNGQWIDFGVSGGPSTQEFEALKNQVELNTNNLATEKTDRETADNELLVMIEDLDNAYQAADEIVKQESKDYTDSEINKIKVDLAAIGNGMIELGDRITVNDIEINNIKQSISQNSKIILVETEVDIGVELPNPEKGNLAYVKTSRRAYIYDNPAADSTNTGAPKGWIFFDDQDGNPQGYLTEGQADMRYRRLDVKIEETDLADALIVKIDNKADKTYVDDELAKEIAERKAEDLKIDNRITNLKPIVAPVQPNGTEPGHVWLEQL